VLESLTLVTHLSLDLHVHNWVDQQLYCFYYHDDIAELFENPPLTLPRLKSLSLAQFRSCGSTMSALLQRHSQIEDFKLEYAISIREPHKNDNTYYRALDPDWVQLVENIAMMHLQRFNFTGVEDWSMATKRFGGENTSLERSRIIDYVLYGYGGNPLSNSGLKKCLDMDIEFWDTSTSPFARSGVREW
jgi:hypothetical protein